MRSIFVEYKTTLGHPIITVSHRLLTLTHKMKTFIVALALVAIAVADVSHLPQYQRGPEADAQILEQDADVLPDQFQYKYATSNGISGSAQGVLTNAGTDGAAIAVQGQDSYTAPGGEVISLSYIADANGYQPQGAHLPTPPPPQPIPDYILRSLEWIAAHPAKPELGQKY